MFQIYFETAVVLAVSVCLFKYSGWYMSAFIIMAYFSSFFPEYGKNSFLAFYSILLMMIFYIFVIKSTKKISLILDVICIVGIINAVISVGQFLGFDFIFHSLRDKTPIIGLMSNPNELSALLAFCFPAFFRKKWFGFLPIMIMSIVITRSVGGIAALICGTFIYLILTKRYKSALALIVPCLFLPVIDNVGLSSIVDNERFGAWDIALQVYSSSWPAGLGVGGYKIMALENIYLFNNNTNMTWWSFLHNEFLQSLIEFGALFIIVLAGFLANIVVNIKKVNPIIIAAITIIFVNSAVNFPFHIATTAVIAMTWLAIFQISVRGNHD